MNGTGINGFRDGALSEESIREMEIVLEFHDNPYAGIADMEAASIYRELKEGIDTENPDTDISTILSDVRHEVYESLLMGGPDRINIEAMKRIKVDKEPDPETDPKKYQEFIKIKTMLCLRALGNIAPEGRDRHLGLLKARHQKLDIEEIERKYFDQETERLITFIESETSIYELMGIRALAEAKEGVYAQTGSDKNRLANAAQEFLIRNLITANPAAITTSSKLLNLKYYKAIVRQMPGALSKGRIGEKAGGIIRAYAGVETPTPEFDDAFASKHGMGVESLKSALDMENTFAENTSLFIGSGVFKQVVKHNPELAETALLKTYYQDGGRAPQEVLDRIETNCLKAKFPKHIERQLRILFEKKLKDKPLKIRSSSELEDKQAASFAGKYDTVACTNCGKDTEQDFQDFLQAIRKIYASVFKNDVMVYRYEMTQKNREAYEKTHTGAVEDLLSADEEMGILIQLANGSRHGKHFYPDLSAVGYSYATESKGFNSKRGCVKIAVGFGNAIVDKDQGILVPLETPIINATRESIPKTQEKIVALDMETGKEVTLESGYAKMGTDEYLDKNDLPSIIKSEGLGVRDREYGHKPLAWGEDANKGQLILKGIVESKTHNIPLKLEYIMQKLKYLFGHDVDCEFTIEHDEQKKKFVIKLVQCRPQNIPENYKPSRMPEEIAEDPRRLILRGKKTVNGTCAKDLTHILYISKDIFKDKNDPSLATQYIREINRLVERGKCLVIAPRRFGSHGTNEGVPATFGDFSKMGGIVEVFDKGFPFMASCGAHFSQDVYDCNMVLANAEEEELENEFFAEASHSEKFPEPSAKIKEFIKVIDVNAEGERIFGKSDKPHVIHVAQDNTSEENGELSIYFAKKGKDIPAPVDNGNGGNTYFEKYEKRENQAEDYGTRVSVIKEPQYAGITSAETETPASTRRPVRWNDDGMGE